ncbi:hypothetical protein EIP86_010032 [Pleurotus ostreatoroseus]|nr:hypothetical protein EIP86_010032 [Pleurotus ostreatoroseus]
MFSVVNEALISTIGHDPMTSFYFQVHDTIRGITGIGEGNGPYMVIHDGFQSLTTWYNFLPGSDRIAMDTHPYFAFDGQPNGEPIAVPALGGDGVMNGGQWPQQACKSWGASLNGSRENIGVTIAGEFSNGINDCGLYVVGLNAQGVSTPPSTAADCDLYNNWDTWNATMKDGFMNLALATMDALGDWFFWTWKIGNDTTTGKVQAPMWSYQLGLENGWIPTDPRKASGMCAKLGVVGEQFDGQFQSWQTGGAGAGTIAATASAQFGTFPPTSIAGVPAGSVSLLPTYTATRGAVTLPPPSFTGSVTASVGDGWADSADTAAMVTPVSGCTYPDAWSAANSPIPTALCPAVGVPAAATSAAVAVSSSDPAAAASVAAPTDPAAAASSVDTAAAAAAVTSAPASVASTAAAAAALTARRHR